MCRETELLKRPQKRILITLDNEVKLTTEIAPDGRVNERIDKDDPKDILLSTERRKIDGVITSPIEDIEDPDLANALRDNPEPS
jgi:hypothetical protein